MKRLKKIVDVAIIIILASSIVFFAITTWYSNTNRTRDLIENSVLTEGRIINIEDPYRTSIAVFYEYYVKDKKMIGKFRTNCLSKEMIRRLINETFEIIYSKKNPENSVLLLFKKDYFRYNINLDRELITEQLGGCK